MTAKEDLDAEFLRFAADPYPNPRDFYDRLRAYDPVFQAPTGFWFITTHELVTELLLVKNDHLWSTNPSRSGITTFYDTPDSYAALIMRNAVMWMDGVDHSRLRGLVNKFFVGKAAARLRRDVERSVELQLDEVLVGDEIDLLHDFAIMLPTKVILDLLGIPHEECEDFVAVADALIATQEPGAGAEVITEADRIFEKAGQRVVELADARRTAPTDDLLSLLVNAQENDDRMSDIEVVAMVLFLIVAGHETTANTLVTGMYHLMSHPDQLAALRADNGLMRGAVAEVLRYDGATRNTGSGRWALQDTEIAGHHIKKGERVVGCLHAANHDPAKFTDPHRFDITRADNDHIVFGNGVHYCLGAAIAKMELEVGFEALLRRCAHLEIATDEVQWKRSWVIRGLTSLPIRWKTT